MARYVLNWQDSDGNTVLHRAVYLQKSNQVEFLLGCSGIDIHLLNKAHYSPATMAIYLAEKKNSFAILNIFLAKVSNFTKLTIVRGSKPLMYCIEGKYYRAARHLLKNQANPNEVSSLSSMSAQRTLQAAPIVKLTPLQVSLIDKEYEFANLLVRYGADVDEIIDGMPLLASTIHGNFNAQSLFLIENGANLAHKLPQSCTYFLLAYAKNNIEIMGALLQNGYCFSSEDLAKVVKDKDEKLLDIMINERQPILILFNFILSNSREKLSLLGAQREFVELAINKIWQTVLFSPELMLFLHTWQLGFLNPLIDITQSILQPAVLENAQTKPTENNAASDLALKTIPHIDNQVQLTSLTEEVLAKIDEINKELAKIPSQTHIPTHLQEINRELLAKCSLTRLTQIKTSLNEWQQKTFLRLSRLTINPIEPQDKDIETFLASSTPTTYLGINISDLLGIHAIENNNHFAVLFQSNLIKDYNKIPEPEQQRFTDILNQLRFCTFRGTQGVKILKHKIKATGEINGRPYQGRLTHTLKSQSFAHRIFLAALYPDFSGVNHKILLIACLLRVANDHDKPLAEPYQMGNLQLGRKAP